MYDKVLYSNEFLRAIDKLRAAGVDRYVDLPRLLLFGWPITERVSLLGDLCGVSFPPQSSCDQFFLELNIRPSKPWISEAVAEITITPSAARSAQEVEVLEAFKRTFPLRETDLARFLDDARRTLGLVPDDQNKAAHCTSTERRRVKDVVRIDVLGPGLPFVSLMHLPELRLHPKTCPKFRCFEGMQYRYTKSPQSYMIPVLTPGKQQMSPVVLLLVAARADPSKKRILPAVMASADWARKFSESTSNVPTVRPMRIGYERLFRPHSLFCVPLIRENVQRHLTDTRAKIESLNDIYALRSNLLKASEMFSDLMGQAINGTYCSDFFDWMNSSSFECCYRHLHVVLRGIFAMFERIMKANSRRGRLAMNFRDALDQPHHLQNRTSLLTTPVKRHSSAASAYEGRGDQWLGEDIARFSPRKFGDGWDLLVHDTLTEVLQAIHNTAREIIRCVLEPSDSAKVLRNFIFPKLEGLETELREEIDGVLVRHNAYRQASRHPHRAEKAREMQQAEKTDIASHFEAAFGPNVLSNPPKYIASDFSRISELFTNIVAYANGKVRDCVQVQLKAEEEVSLPLAQFADHNVTLYDMNKRLTPPCQWLCAQSLISDFRVLILETALPKKLPCIFTSSDIAAASDEDICRLMECTTLLDADQDIARKKRENLERRIAAFEDFLKFTESDPGAQTDSTSEDMFTPTDSSCVDDLDSVSTLTIMCTPEESVIGV